MRNLLVIVLAMLIHFWVAAQNVGIEIDTPSAILHVYDTLTLDPTLKLQSDAGVDIEMHTPGQNTKSIKFYDGGELKSSIGRFGSELRFYTNYTPIIPFAALKVTNTNTVGVNFSPFGTPDQTLDVNGKIKIGDDLRTPTEGTLRYNSSSKVLQVYDGNSWNSGSTPWSLTGDNIHYNNGAVLIGRSTTIGAEIFGVRYNSSGTDYGGMYMEANGSSSSRPFYGYAVDGIAKMWHYFDGGDDSWKVNMSGTRLTVQRGGNVGIGLASPLAKLDVLGGEWDVENSEGDLRVGNSNYRLAVGVATDGAGAGITRMYAKGGRAKLILGSDDSDVLTIDSDNQVGIGVNSPAGDLHIYDASGLADLRLESDNGNAIIRLDASTGNTSYSQLRFTEGGALSGAIWYNYGNNSIEVFEGGLALSVRDARVGIGTTPSGNHKLSVAGSIISEEIKVELQEDWPDYVFEENYNLMSIGELALYIDRNGHLPGVPSATQVKEEKGIELGEMNRILLEKVEELTLMMIRQQDEIDKLKAKLK